MLCNLWVLVRVGECLRFPRMQRTIIASMVCIITGLEPFGLFLLVMS